MTHFRFPKPFSIIFFCNFFYLIFFLTNLFCRSSWMRWLIVTNIMWYIEMWNLVMWVTIIFVLFQTNHVENWFLFLFVFFFSKHNFWLFFFLSISIRVLRKDFCQFRRRIEIGWFWPGEKTFTRYHNVTTRFVYIGSVSNNSIRFFLKNEKKSKKNNTKQIMFPKIIIMIYTNHHLQKNHLHLQMITKFCFIW